MGVKMVTGIQNLIIISRKEFSTLLNNWVILVILSAYSLFIIVTVFNFYNSLNGNSSGELLFGYNAGLAASNYLFSCLTLYGAIVGIMIGCSSISCERHNKSLNTLIVKPVYRDTIINGKLAGSTMFLIFVLSFTTVFYTTGILILCGNSLESYLFDYVTHTIVVLGYSIVYVMVFLSLSMLISIIIKDQAFAMLLGFTLLYISDLMRSVDFAMNLSTLLGNDGIYDKLVYLSPSGSLWAVQQKLFENTSGLMDVISSIFPDVLKFLICVIVACFLSYSLFNRSDIA